MKPGRPAGRVTSRDIAREAGVSQPTVSRALRGDPRVAAATVELVRRTAARLGYVPHAAAQSLITSRAGTVAIVVAELDNPFYPELVEALHLELELAGYRAVLVSERAAGEQGGAPALLRSGLVDGAIVAAATDDEPTRRFLREEPAPVVLIVRELEGSGRDAVVADNAAGGAQAGELLVELGHRRIGLICGPDGTSTALAREAGFAASLAQAGIELEAGLCRRGEYAPESGRRLCQELLALGSPPTAIFCGNDAIALGALDAARGRGVAVPARLSVVGFDDVPLAAWDSFQLTTVHQPLAEMAAEAARLLVERIEGGGGQPRRAVFPTRLVRRRSAAPL